MKQAGPPGCPSDPNDNAPGRGDVLTRYRIFAQQVELPRTLGEAGLEAKTELLFVIGKV